MDPAILSFRQFSSFPQNQIPPHPQQQQDMFLQHLAQQQNSQSGEFVSRFTQNSIVDDDLGKTLLATSLFQSF